MRKIKEILENLNTKYGNTRREERFWKNNKWLKKEIGKLRENEGVFVHATSMDGVSSLLNSSGGTLRVSSIGSKRYFNREVLFLVRGEVENAFDGDIGDIDLADNPRDFGYDEIHIKNFEVIGLFIPEDNDNRWDIDIFADAFHFITMILDKNIEVIHESNDKSVIDYVVRKDYMKYSDEEYIDIWNYKYNLDIPEDHLVD